MSMLSEKKIEIETKLNDLLKDKLKDIDIKVANYRTQLESAAYSTSEVMQIKKVLDAINEVIKYEEAEAIKVENQHVEATLVKEQVIPSNEIAITPSITNTAKTENISEVNADANISITSRPGMTSIDFPHRG